MDYIQDCFIDMAERKSQAEEKIRRQAQTDSLTGIPNRDAFNRALSDALTLASDNNQKLSIYLIDLDNFKEINDTRGHQRGDNVLKLMAKRLVNGVPQARFIARVGGDEFMLLLGDTHSSSHHIALLSDDLIRLIKQPFFLSFGEVIMSASVGVALFPEDGKNSRELLGAVDQAMYHAKKSGRHTVRRFNKELKNTLLNKLALIKDLRHAILNDEFHLVYQPILNRQGILTKFEALIRWRHPLKGSIPPDQFIPFAEESGDIVEIGAWVIQEAKRALQQVRAVYGDDIQISVNVSPVQLSNHHGKTTEFLNQLLVLSDDETRKNGLVVEITEHTLMSLDESTRNALLGFREKGIEVALDDFGTGYSSLAYIMNYDIDYLKIDKGFVQKLDDESSSAASLCEAIISMAHKLNMSVIAEGVETKAQLDLLREYGCDYLQGYYFSKPITLEQVLVYQQDKDRL
jgi:diguanylate cyclase (GGDEF)-like protein